MRLSIGDIQQAVAAQGTPEMPDVMVTGVATDSREIGPGDLFVCIVGERVDGHDFALAAVKAGAVAVLAERPLPGLNVPVLVVSHTVQALGQLAALWRAGTRAVVVGVTGTAGKTTVKEVLRQVLSVHGITACSEKNHNNQIGMPVSMLRAPQDAVFWVMEAGISHAGDMEELASILRPDVGLVLNVGPGHTEGLGQRGVAWHKAQLLAHLAPEGRGVISGDYPDLVREARLVCRKLTFFSAAGRPMSYRGAYSGPVGENRGLYRLWLDGDPLDVETPFRGDYGTENAVAVVAVAHMLGLSHEEISEGFARATLPDQRFQLRRINAWQAIDDTYNANPLSMSRMLDAAAELAGANPLVCVLGEMGELGSVAEAEHERLGRHLAQLRPKVIFWRGGQLAALRAGLDAARYTGAVLPTQDAAQFLRDLDVSVPESKGGVILFKGSRFNHLEELWSAFLAREEGDHVL